METTKHTPGPWRIETWNYDKATPPREALMVQTDRDAVAEVCNIWQNANEVERRDVEAEKQANARLIAAAPALLAALVELIEQLEGIGIPDWHGAEGLSLTQARAAIAKATGKEVETP